MNHFSVELDVDRRTMSYQVTNAGGDVVVDFQSGLYAEELGRVDNEVPNLEFGLPGVADHAYYPPYRWAFSELKVTATH